MRKLLFVLITSLTIFLCGCDSPYFTGNFDYRIYNESSKIVSVYVENTSDKYTINPHESIEITKNNHNELKLVDKPRVTLNHDNTDYYIRDIPYRVITIWNPQDYDITLFELNGMMGDDFGEYLTIKSKTIEKIKLYTSDPSFLQNIQVMD